MMTLLKTGTESGYTLIEVLVVLIIIGILVAFAVPKYYRSIEKDRASEAVNLALVLKGAQDRYNSKYGGYCIGALTAVAAGTACNGFDIAPPPLHFFGTAALPPAFVVGSVAGSWELTLTRNATPELYGSYTISYDAEPAQTPYLTCSQSNCETDLLPSPN